MNIIERYFLNDSFLICFECFSAKSIVLVRVHNQQLHGANILLVFDFQSIHIPLHMHVYNIYSGFTPQVQIYIGDYRRISHETIL